MNAIPIPQPPTFDPTEYTYLAAILRHPALGNRASDRAALKEVLSINLNVVLAALDLAGKVDGGTATALNRRCKELGAKFGPSAHVFVSVANDDGTFLVVYPHGQLKSRPIYFRGNCWDEMFAEAEAHAAAIPDPDAEYASWDPALLRSVSMAAE